jgi:hypothetical protein
LKWGLGDPTPTSLQTSAFHGFNAGHDAAIERLFNGSQLYCTTSICVLMAPLYPVHGSLVDYLEFRGYDADPAGRVVCNLRECPDDQESCTEGTYFGTNDPYDGGAFNSSLVINPPLTFDTSQNAYAIHCSIIGGSQDTRLGNFRIETHLQVSPAPASATFGDVPTGHPFFQFVEALVASGITAGCGGGNYCPEDPVTRGQMAVFLSAALGLHWPG